MKTSKQILKDYEKNENNIKIMKNEQEEIIDLMPSFSNFKEYKSEEYHNKSVEYHNKYDEKIKSLTASIKDCKIKREVLKNNFNVALFNEILPVFCNVMNKYEGKKLGEKTEKKIESELFELTGYRIGSIGYNEKSFTIYYNKFNYNNDLTIGIKFNHNNEKYMLIDNTIQHLNANDFTIFYRSNDYIDNINKYIKDIKKLYNKCKSMQEELRSLTSTFNSMKVENIVNLNMSDYSFKELI